MSVTLRTIAGGAAGMTMLFGVGYLAFKMGEEVGRVETEYEYKVSQLPTPQKKRKGLLGFLRHGELQINVKTKGE